MKLGASILGVLVLLAWSPFVLAKDRPAGPMANVGTINCSSVPQLTTMEISYFKVGTVTEPASCSAGQSCQGTATAVFEIHAPLSSAKAWGEAYSNGAQFSSCTISVPGKNGPETLTFSNLMITSVLAEGKREDDSPLPEYYTDVIFGPGTTGNARQVGWNLFHQPN